MPQIKEGTVTIIVPDTIEIPEKAGKLKPEEVKRIPKVRRGIGLACANTAVEMGKKGDEFAVPDTPPAELIRLGAMAEEIDTVISDVEVALNTLKQANLLIDARALDLLGRVNDQVKALGKRDPSILRRFGTVSEYFRNKRPSGPTEDPPVD